MRKRKESNTSGFLDSPKAFFFRGRTQSMDLEDLKKLHVSGSGSLSPDLRGSSTHGAPQSQDVSVNFAYRIESYCK